MIPAYDVRKDLYNDAGAQDEWTIRTTQNLSASTKSGENGMGSRRLAHPTGKSRDTKTKKADQRQRGFFNRIRESLGGVWGRGWLGVWRSGSRWEEAVEVMEKTRPDGGSIEDIRQDHRQRKRRVGTGGGRWDGEAHRPRHPSQQWFVQLVEAPCISPP